MSCASKRARHWSQLVADYDVDMTCVRAFVRSVDRLSAGAGTRRNCARRGRGNRLRDVRPREVAPELGLSDNGMDAVEMLH
jgi:hypothetical protein